MCTDNGKQNDDHDLPISIKLSRSTSSYDCRICSGTHTHTRTYPSVESEESLCVCVCECIEPHRISGGQLDFLYFSYAMARVRVQICNRTNGKINNKNPNATQTHQWVTTTATAINSFTTQLRNYTLVCVRACVHCAELLHVIHVNGRQRKENPMDSNRHRASGELCKQNFTPIDSEESEFLQIIVNDHRTYRRILYDPNCTSVATPYEKWTHSLFIDENLRRTSIRCPMN